MDKNLKRQLYAERLAKEIEENKSKAEKRATKKADAAKVKAVAAEKKVEGVKEENSETPQ